MSSTHARTLLLVDCYPSGKEPLLAWNTSAEEDSDPYTRPPRPTVWTTFCRAVLEYCRVVFDVCPPAAEPLSVQVVGSPKPITVNGWAVDDQNSVKVLNGLSQIDPVAQTGHDGRLRYALEAALSSLLSEPEPKPPLHVRLLFLTTACDPGTGIYCYRECPKNPYVDIRTVCVEALEAGTQRLRGAKADNLRKIVVDLVVLRAHDVYEQAMLPSDLGVEQYSGNLTATIYNFPCTTAPRALVNLARLHRNLLSLAVTAIPMRKRDESVPNQKVMLLYGSADHDHVAALVTGNMKSVRLYALEEEWLKHRTQVVKFQVAKMEDPAAQFVRCAHPVTAFQDGDLISQTFLGCLLQADAPTYYFCSPGKPTLTKRYTSQKASPVFTHMLRARDGILFLHCLHGCQNPLRELANHPGTPKVVDASNPKFKHFVASIIKPNVFAPDSLTPASRAVRFENSMAGTEEGEVGDCDSEDSIDNGLGVDRGKKDKNCFRTYRPNEDTEKFGASPANKSSLLTTTQLLHSETKWWKILYAVDHELDNSNPLKENEEDWSEIRKGERSGGGNTSIVRILMEETPVKEIVANLYRRLVIQFELSRPSDAYLKDLLDDVQVHGESCDGKYFPHHSGEEDEFWRKLAYRWLRRIFYDAARISCDNGWRNREFFEYVRAQVTPKGHDRRPPSDAMQTDDPENPDSRTGREGRGNAQDFSWQQFNRHQNMSAREQQDLITDERMNPERASTRRWRNTESRWSDLSLKAGRPTMYDQPNLQRSSDGRRKTKGVRNGLAPGTGGPSYLLPPKVSREELIRLQQTWSAGLGSGNSFLRKYWSGKRTDLAAPVVIPPIGWDSIDDDDDRENCGDSAVKRAKWKDFSGRMISTD